MTNLWLTAEDYARLCHYKDIINLIHSAPSIANWDAGKVFLFMLQSYILVL